MAMVAVRPPQASASDSRGPIPDTATKTPTSSVNVFILPQPLPSGGVAFEAMFSADTFATAQLSYQGGRGGSQEKALHERDGSPRRGTGWKRFPTILGQTRRSWRGWKPAEGLKDTQNRGLLGENGQGVGKGFECLAGHLRRYEGMTGVPSMIGGVDGGEHARTQKQPGDQRDEKLAHQWREARSHD